MATTMNVAISPELKAHVDRQVAEGSYASSSEYVRDLIRQDRRRKAEQRLAALVQEGLESPLEPPDPAYWQKRRQALRRSIAKRR
ncbi:MAG: type II toxin-antitoxin system ParD family antitoxin [Alphaproteobacteria bacterium]|nr:type II toxin-antitoxin system ParD family antitoxin [Alphaproteobacteria bacterium]